MQRRSNLPSLKRPPVLKNKKILTLIILVCYTMGVRKEKNMSFKEELEQFEKSGMDLFKIVVANEVKTLQNVSNEDFEKVCSVVHEYWIKDCETITSLENVVQAVNKYLEEGNNIDNIENEDILERLVY